MAIPTNLPDLSDLIVGTASGDTGVLKFAPVVSNGVRTRNRWNADGLNGRVYGIQLSPDGEDLYILTVNGKGVKHVANVPAGTGKDLSNGRSASGLRTFYSYATGVKIASDYELAYRSQTAVSLVKV